MLHHALDRRQSVAQAVRRAQRRPSPASAWIPKLSTHLAVLQHLHRLAHLPDDRARIAAHEGVAPEVFAALDRLEQERLARPADLAVGRERRFDIRQQPAGDGDQVALGGQLQELVECRVNT